MCDGFTSGLVIQKRVMKHYTLIVSKAEPPLSTQQFHRLHFCVNIANCFTL
jgi:hypothetical protein